MAFYKVKASGGGYTEGDIIDIVDNELYAIITRSVPLEPADPIVQDISSALYGTGGIAAFPAGAVAANGVSMAEVIRYMQETQLSKIAAASAGGLTATADSLAYGIGEIERHFHGWERWFCAAAVPNAEIHVADRIGATAASKTPFTITSGNDTWGAWLQILGSSDTPVIAGNVKYDLHRMMVLVANQVSPYFIQIAFGATGDGAVTANTFSSIVINPASNTDRTEAFPFMSRRQAVGTKGWARCWCVGSNAKTLTIMFGLHEYEG
jgi:hypothetical protein